MFKKQYYKNKIGEMLFFVFLLKLIDILLKIILTNMISITIVSVS